MRKFMEYEIIDNVTVQFILALCMLHHKQGRAISFLAVFVRSLKLFPSRLTTPPA